jgi:hypothetical protein
LRPKSKSQETPFSGQSKRRLHQDLSLIRFFAISRGRSFYFFFFLFKHNRAAFLRSTFATLMDEESTFHLPDGVDLLLRVAYTSRESNGVIVSACLLLFVSRRCKNCLLDVGGRVLHLVSRGGRLVVRNLSAYVSFS